MDHLEVRLWAMEEELLASQAKTDAIQLALQVIMSKLEIDVEIPKENPEVNFTFAKDNESVSFNAGKMRVKPASPSDLDGDL